MRKRLVVAGIVESTFALGLLAVAIANRPSHEDTITLGQGSKYQQVRDAVVTRHTAAVLSAWSSSYTLALVLSLLVVVAVVAIMSISPRIHVVGAGRPSHQG